MVAIWNIFYHKKTQKLWNIGTNACISTYLYTYVRVKIPNKPILITKNADIKCAEFIDFVLPVNLL